MIGISRKDFDKIINFARASVKEFNGAEIGGMAILKQDEDGDWIIKHPTILKQEVTSSTCTLDKEALANYYTKSMMKHGTDIKFVWWHSHGKGSVFWSGTDETAIKEYKGGNWSVSLVVNADADYRLRVDYWKPIPAKLDKLELEFDGEKDVKIPSSITNQVKKFVKEQATSVVKWNSKSKGNQMNLHGYGYGYGGYSYSDGYYTEQFPKEWHKLGLDWWQKKALSEVQSDLKNYANGTLSYVDLEGTINDANKDLNEKGIISIPGERKLFKLVDSKQNVNVLKYFEEI